MAPAASLRTTVEAALCVRGFRMKTPTGPTRSSKYSSVIGVFSWNPAPMQKGSVSAGTMCSVGE